MSPAPFARLVRPGSRGSESVCGRRGGWWPTRAFRETLFWKPRLEPNNTRSFGQSNRTSRHAGASQWDLPMESQSLVTYGHLDDIVTTDGDSWMTLAT